MFARRARRRGHQRRRCITARASVTSSRRVTRFVIPRRAMDSAFFSPLKRASPGAGNESRAIERAAPGAVNRYTSAVARTARSFIAEHLFPSCTIPPSRRRPG